MDAMGTSYEHLQPSLAKREHAHCLARDLKLFLQTKKELNGHGRRIRDNRKYVFSERGKMHATLTQQKSDRKQICRIKFCLWFQFRSTVLLKLPTSQLTSQLGRSFHTTERRAFRAPFPSGINCYTQESSTNSEITAAVKTNSGKNQVTTDVHRLVSVLDGGKTRGERKIFVSYFPHTIAIWAPYPRDGHETRRADTWICSVQFAAKIKFKKKDNMVHILERTMAQLYVVINNATGEERSSSRSALLPYEIRALRASTQFSLRPFKCESRHHVVKYENTHRTPHTKCLQPKTTVVGSNTY